jgi:phosphoglycerate dehydrogenase-like enzyme
MGVRVAVLDDYQDVARGYADWSALPAEVDVFHDHVADHDLLVRRLQPYQVVSAMRERTPFPRALLEALPNLGLLVTTGMRNDSIDLVAATECGVTVCGTGGGSSPSVSGSSTAELTWGLILALARDIPTEERNLRAGDWQRSIGAGLAGRTLGLVGLGRIGSQVAAIGRAFDMSVLAWSENLTDETAERAGARRVDLNDLFASSDVVSIHTKLSPRTRGVVGAEQISLMHAGSYLVNTSRGPIVDEAALQTALHEGRIAGAGLDVFDREPLPADDPWLDVPRTVLTPHLGYVTEGNYAAFYADTVECIGAYLAGTPVRVLNGPA